MDSREPPQFKCSRFSYPLIRCEAKNVWPFDPEWRVYYKDTDEMVEWGRGYSAFLTMQQGHYARIEMHLGTERRLTAYGGWFGQRLRFRMSPL